MTAEQIVILIGGWLLVSVPIVTMIVRANRRDLRIVKRRRQEWIDSGADPDEEPRFYRGPIS
jgi:hypothetical protein